MKIFSLFISVLLLVACSNPGKQLPASGWAGQLAVPYPLPQAKDSLFILLKQCNEDSNAVNILNQIAIGFFNSNLDSSIHYDKRALQIAKKIKWKRGIAASYGDLGVFYSWKSDYNSALESYKNAVQLDKENKTLKQLAVHLGNIGTIYEKLSDYPKALDYDFQSLKISEELNRLYGKKNGKYGMQRQNANIGIIYSNQGDFKKALSYYHKALSIAKELADSSAIAVNLGNIGTVYFRKRNFNQALDYYFQSLKLDEAGGNRIGIARNVGNIGNVYSELGKEFSSNRTAADSLLKKAMAYYTRALQDNLAIDNRSEIATGLGNIGVLNRQMRNYRAAFQYIFRSLAMNDSMRIMGGMKENYASLSALYEQADVDLPDSSGGNLLNREQMRLRALYYYKRYIAVRDTLFSEENSKQLVRKEMNFEFGKKEAAAKAEQDKKNAIQQAEAKKQKVIIFSVVACLLLVVCFAAFIFRSLRKTSKQKQVIQHQKELVEEKQKEILDSIYYARRIQRALITNEKYFIKNLNRLSKK